MSECVCQCVCVCVCMRVCACVCIHAIRNTFPSLSIQSQHTNTSLKFINVLLESHTIFRSGTEHYQNALYIQHMLCITIHAAHTATVTYGFDNTLAYILSCRVRNAIPLWYWIFLVYLYVLFIINLSCVLTTEMDKLYAIAMWPKKNFCIRENHHRSCQPHSTYRKRYNGWGKLVYISW